MVTSSLSSASTKVSTWEGQRRGGGVKDDQGEKEAGGQSCRTRRKMGGIYCVGRRREGGWGREGNGKEAEDEEDAGGS